MTTQAFTEVPDLLDGGLADPELSLEGAQPPAAPTPEAASAQPPADADREALAQRAARLEADNQRLLRDRQQFQQQADRAGVQAEASAHYQRRVIEIERDQQVTTEDAQRLAGLETRALLAEFRAHDLLAESLSRQSGIPKQTLFALRGELEMRNYVENFSQTMGPTARELAEAKAELAKLRATVNQLVRGQVPAQPFNAPPAGGGGSMSWTQAQKITKLSDLSDAQYEKLIANAR